MSGWLVPIIVAIIGGPLMWGLRRFDRRNTEQHAQNLNVLHFIREDISEVKGDVKGINAKVDNHILWHLDHGDK